VLVLHATNGDDTLSVSLIGSDLVVTDADGTNVHFTPEQYPHIAKIDADGLGGNDTIAIQSTLDIPCNIQGGDGIDNITTGKEGDTIHGGSQDDTVNAGEGIDDIWGDDGNDNLFGGDLPPFFVPGAMGVSF
jgi:Ca2+-binding RTX toxin-like protein